VRFGVLVTAALLVDYGGFCLPVRAVSSRKGSRTSSTVGRSTPNLSSRNAGLPGSGSYLRSSRGQATGPTPIFGARPGGPSSVTVRPTDTLEQGTLEGIRAEGIGPASGPLAPMHLVLHSHSFKAVRRYTQPRCVR
jgi:hypothetical protein